MTIAPTIPAATASAPQGSGLGPLPASAVPVPAAGAAAPAGAGERCGADADADADADAEGDGAGVEAAVPDVDSAARTGAVRATRSTGSPAPSDDSRTARPSGVRASPSP